jgi:hypothetical protein
MKETVRNIIVATVTGMIALTTAHGQPNTIIVDEFGKGFYNGVPLSSGVIPDPINFNNPGFAYVLPFIYNWSVPSADIQLSEPGSTLPSDMLRFTRDPSGPNTLLFFYSDASAADAPDAPADQFGLPSPVFSYLNTAETGLFANPYSEAGPNGFLYTALPNQPGTDNTGVALQYTFVSDGVVPEPSSLALLAGGFGILYGFKLLRRKTVA